MDIKNNFNIGGKTAEVIIQKSTNKNKKFMANVHGNLFILETPTFQIIQYIMMMTENKDT